MSGMYSVSVYVRGMFIGVLASYLLCPLQHNYRQKVSHLLIGDTSMIPPEGVTAEQCTRAAPPFDGAAHSELQTVSSIQPVHSD